MSPFSLKGFGFNGGLKGFGFSNRNTFVWKDIDAENYWNRLTIANGGTEIDTLSLYNAPVNNVKKGLDNLFVNTKVFAPNMFNGAIYFVLGNTAATQALNATSFGSLYDLTFFGSPIHDVNGITWNGISQYGFTNVEMNSHFPTGRLIGHSVKNATLSSLKRTMGVQGTSSSYRSWLLTSTSPTQTQGVAMGGSTRVTAPFRIDSGLVNVIVISGNNNRLFRSGVLMNTLNITYRTQGGQYYWVGASSQNGGFGTSLACTGQFYHICGDSSGFSDLQVQQFANELSTFYSIIGRTI